jgi:hypothetical protein
MVSEDGEFGAFQIAPKDLESRDNGQHFSVLSVVVAFSRKEFLGREGNRVPNTKIISLFQKSTTSKVARITCEAVGLAQLRVFEDWGIDNSITKELKRRLGFSRPDSGGVFGSESCQRKSNLGVVAYETTEIVGEAQEGPDVFFGRGPRPFLHDSYLVRVNTDTRGIDHMTKEFDRLFEEVTLFELDVVVVLLQEGEDFINMLDMFFEGLGVDEDVIHIHQDILANTGTEELVHGTLESGRSIAKAKGHDKPFIVSNRSCEGCLRDICRLNTYLVIA